ncbi:hypothetical protein OMAG_001249 [Candidatus Omnitrophus magneticus]|uniref:Uncharacterized protein n=1 Tax=Candidatus Omnitrophus magneticus TaxID=1609969 RepID=A0A0F0CNI3_9BACT|nr:hypothetical protein OMAG_001249 [Candidatus Omnitrophus magneticus]
MRRKILSTISPHCPNTLLSKNETSCSCAYLYFFSTFQQPYLLHISVELPFANEYDQYLFLQQCIPSRGNTLGPQEVSFSDIHELLCSGFFV